MRYRGGQGRHAGGEGQLPAGQADDRRGRRLLRTLHCWRIVYAVPGGIPMHVGRCCGPGVPAMTVQPSKPALKQELLGLVSRDLDTLVSALRATREGATHEEAKPENDKDTRALEQSYLARGQAARVEELRTAAEAISKLTTRVFEATDPVALGALATLCEVDADPPSEPVVVLISPHGGGHQLAEGRVRVVTPVSPLGRALLGKRVGEQLGLSTRGRERQLEIVRIA